MPKKPQAQVCCGEVALHDAVLACDPSAPFRSYRAGYKSRVPLRLWGSCSCHQPLLRLRQNLFEHVPYSTSRIRHTLGGSLMMLSKQPVVKTQIPKLKKPWVFVVIFTKQKKNWWRFHLKKRYEERLLRSKPVLKAFMVWLKDIKEKIRPNNSAFTTK